ncbi:hypothetical protein D3C77_268400 [compost metagenome]
MGYLLYSPVDFNLLWDGDQVFIQFVGMEEWIIVDKIFLPHSLEHWQASVPSHLIDTLPVFLEAFPERGVLQLWSGYFISTPPGESLWIRSPVNQPPAHTHFTLEGIVETDWWAGPLFTNIVISKTDVPILFRRNKPLLQIIPLPRSSHLRDRKPSITLSDISATTPSEFLDRMKETADRRNGEHSGSYRKQAKQFRRGHGNT